VSKQRTVLLLKRSQFIVRGLGEKFTSQIFACFWLKTAMNLSNPSKRILPGADCAPLGVLELTLNPSEMQRGRPKLSEFFDPDQNGGESPQKLIVLGELLYEAGRSAL